MIDVDRADYVLRLIAARCPELSPGELAAIESALAGRDDTESISREVAEGIVDALDELDQRMAALEGA